MSIELAKQLWEARLQGHVVELRESNLPPDEGAAYNIQRAQLELAEPIGFKIGATTQAAVEALGISGPFFGCLLKRFSHPSGADVTIPSNHHAFIESEFVVALAHDLPGRSKEYTVEEVSEAVDWIGPGLEIVATRFKMELKGNGIRAIADGGVNLDFVLSKPSPNWKEFDIAAHRAELSINGRKIASGLGGDSIFGHPLKAVAWLAVHDQLQGRGLKTGDIVTTGSCTGLAPIKAGDNAVADFGGFGQVEARFASDPS